MKIKTTILLLVLNALVFFFLLKQKSPFEIGDEGEDDRILSFAPPVHEVKRIEIQAGEDHYSLEKLGTEWFVNEPIQWAANPFAVRRMISRLDAGEAQVVFPVTDIIQRNQTLDDFGLQDPKISLTLGFEEKDYILSFGAPVEIGDRVYMLTPGKDEIVVVDSGLLQPFLLSAEELKADSILSIPLFEVESVIVEFTPEGARQRFKKKDQKWMIDSPFSAIASHEAMQSALDKLLNLDAQILGELPPEQIDIQHFNAVCRIEVIGNRRNEVLLLNHFLVNGEPSEDFYLAKMEGRKTYFVLSRPEVDRWRTASNDFRKKNLFEFSPESVTKLEIFEHTEVSSQISFLRLENNDWKCFSESEVYTKPDSFELDAPMVYEALDLLQSLIVMDFVNDTPTAEDLEVYGLSEPLMTITVEADRVFTLEVGNGVEESAQFYAKLRESDGIVTVANEILELFTTDPFHYRNRNLTLFEEDAGFSYFVLGAKESESQLDSRSIESFLENSQQELAVEDAQARIQAIEALLRDFRSEGFLKTEELEEGIGFPFELRFYSDVGSELGRLELTDRLAGSLQIGRLEDEEHLILLPVEMIDALFPLLHDLRIPEEHEFPEEKAPEPEEVEVSEEETSDNES